MTSKTTLNEKSEQVFAVAVRMPSQMTVREATDKLKFPFIERVTTLGDAFSNLVTNQMLDPNKNKKILISPRKFWWFGVILIERMKFSKVKKALKQFGIVDKVSLPPYSEVEPDDYLNDAGLSRFSNESRKLGEAKRFDDVAFRKKVAEVDEADRKLRKVINRKGNTVAEVAKFLNNPTNTPEMREALMHVLIRQFNDESWTRGKPV